MLLKKLYLDNFLSYSSPQLAEFCEGLNIIIGDNAVGKTNLVEGVYYASLGKSSRNLKDKELICWDNAPKGARLKLMVKSRYGNHTVEIFIDGQGKKRIVVDSLPLTKLTELIGVINIVFFSPNEMKLIKDSPVDRRRFVDISLSQQNKVYFYTLIKYNKLLAQRNKALKTQQNSAKFAEILEIITAQMIECEEYIIKQRKIFVDSLVPIANEAHLALTDNKEKLDLFYETETTEYDNIKDFLTKAYSESYEKDCRLEYTSVGVHRDDLKILADNVEVRKYGSQGQQRTTALSLKLAELEIFRANTGEYPILILDDVLSELDINRQKALFNRIKGVQTLITCTEFNLEIDEKYAIHTVKDKKITTDYRGKDKC